MKPERIQSPDHGATTTGPDDSASLSSTPLVRLLDGETLNAPPQFARSEAIEILDFMADLNHGPTGGGPESPGAARALDLLGAYLSEDPEGAALLDVVRRATAFETESERRAPAAATAHEALERLQILAQVRDQGHSGDQWVATALPTATHARYALALLVSDDAPSPELFEQIAEHLVQHDEAGDDDRAYVERLRKAAVDQSAAAS